MRTTSLHLFGCLSVISLALGCGAAPGEDALAETSEAATAFSAKINFQPAGSAIPSGYLVDAANVYGARGNGLTYGWSGDNTSQSRDRNLAL